MVRCLTAADVRCLHLDRGAQLGLFVGRYQQFIRENCLCIDKASFISYADHDPRAFKLRGRTNAPKTKWREEGRRFGSTREERAHFESRRKDKRNLAGWEAEAGCRD